LSNARKSVEPYGGVVSAEFFDIGQSRSVPWERRREGGRLLTALKDPRRTWTGVVVGEGTRCWFGNQFSLIAPRFAAHAVHLWVPEPGGKFDPRNPSHTMLMRCSAGWARSRVGDAGSCRSVHRGTCCAGGARSVGDGCGGGGAGSTCAISGRVVSQAYG
jgi:hypothetical protein